MIVDHPIAVKKHQNRAPPQHLNTIESQLIAHLRWQADLPRYYNPLTNILIQEIKGCDGEQNGHPNPIHHRDVDDY